MRRLKPLDLGLGGEVPQNGGGWAWCEEAQGVCGRARWEKVIASALGIGVVRRSEASGVGRVAKMARSDGGWDSSEEAYSVGGCARGEEAQSVGVGVGSGVSGLKALAGGLGVRRLEVPAAVLWPGRLWGSGAALETVAKAATVCRSLRS